MDLLKALAQIPQLVEQYVTVAGQLATAQKEREENRLLNEDDIMAYLGRSEETIRYYERLGLEPYRKGSSRWWLKRDVDAWLASGKVNRQQHPKRVAIKTKPVGGSGGSVQ